MCWFSTEYANQIEEAKTGQRLAIKQMHWHSNWVVRETGARTIPGSIAGTFLIPIGLL
jgi:hypothetical protein